MTLPGFTAELTLNDKRHHYTLTEAFDLGREDRIIPQLPRILDCWCFRNLSYCCCKNDDGTWTCGKSGQA